MFDFKSYSQPPTFARVGKTLLYTAAFNTAIAVLLSIVGFSHPFLHTLGFSQCIGLTICICVMWTMYAVRKKGIVMRGAANIAALIVGAFGGTAIGASVISFPEDVLSVTNTFLWKIVGISLLFGIIIIYFFHSREKLSATVQMAQEERIKRLSSEKLALEANLKRLQAQVEPHFLFNTLSNIVSLMDTDPSKAKSMQMDLIRYLRTALGRAREKETTLGQEVDLIRAYLDIFKIRMGERLHYTIEIPKGLNDTPLAPMLLQPIVENALLHGLEPKIEGGHIHIRAERRSDTIRIEISDTGNGLVFHQQPGVGLANVRERLNQLYGSRGMLMLEENQPCGVVAAIEMPLALPSLEKHH